MIVVDAVGVAGLVISVSLIGAVAGSATEYLAVEKRLPTLHAAAFFVSAAVAALLAIPADWVASQFFGGEGRLIVVMALHASAAACAQRAWFTSGYAYGRELMMEHGDEWPDHIGEEVRP